MVAEKTIIEGIVTRTLAAKRRAATKEEVTRIVKGIIAKINVMNQYDEYTVQIWNRPLDQILIPNEFKDFLIPTAVRVDPTNIKTNNLIINGKTTVSNDPQEYSDWINLILEYRSLFKKDIKEDMTTLDKCRVPKSLFDVLPIITVGDAKDDNDPEAVCSVSSLDEPFIPIRLKPEVKVLLRSDYFNTNVYQIVTDYLVKFLI